MGIEVQYSPIFETYICIVFGEKRKVLYASPEYDSRAGAIQDARRYCDANGITGRAERKTQKKGLTPPS